MFFYSIPKEIPIFLAYSSKFHWSSTGGGGGGVGRWVGVGIKCNCPLYMLHEYPAEYPETLKQPLKIGGYVDTQSPVTTYLHIHLVNIFKIIVTT